MMEIKENLIEKMDRMVKSGLNGMVEVLMNEGLSEHESVLFIYECAENWWTSEWEASEEAR